MRLQNILPLALCLAVASGQDTVFEGQPALELTNNSLKMTILPQGATMASLVLADDPPGLNPLWNPVKLARDAGRTAPFNGAFGHFVCVDGFGQPSADERAAGLPGHGELHLLNLAVTRTKEATGHSVTLRGTLPIVQESFSRTFRMTEGENVVYVDSELQNLMGFDRPVNWAEHATVASPFVEAGKVVIFLSGTRSQTRPYDLNQPGRGNTPPRTQRRLKPGIDFTWPMAPGLDGSTADLSAFPTNPHYLDHAATLLDPGRKLEWVAALNTEKRLIYGYVFRREDYPWIQHWGNYTSPTELVRGMEFGTQPYDVSRREAVTTGSMFGTPTYRWLPAKGKLESHFLLFYCRAPEGMQTVADVQMEAGRIVISGAAGKQVVLRVSKAL